jgi:hypothetical protein
MSCSVTCRKNKIGQMYDKYESLGIALKHTKLSAERSQSGDFDVSIYINPLFLIRRTK